MSTKMVRKTLSEETKSAKIPNGKGSKGFTPGIRLRFALIQVPTRIKCNRRNLRLPMNLTMVSLWRSVLVLRSKASSSSLAMAAILNCVGLFTVWSDGDVFMRGTPAQRGWTFSHTAGEAAERLYSLRIRRAGLCVGFGVSRVHDDCYRAPAGIGSVASAFAASQ